MKYLSIILIAILMINCSREEISPVSTEENNFDEPVSFVILSPAEGDVWKTGEEHEIKWQAEESSATVSIYIIKKKEYYKKYITNGTSNDGIYKWKVSEETVPSHHYQIVIANSSLPDLKSYSKVFSIINEDDGF